MDKKLFFALYNFYNAQKGFGKAVLLTDRACPFIFMAIFAVMSGYLAFNSMFTELTLFAGVPLATLIICRTIRYLSKRKRPSIAFNLNGPHAGKASYSFPSNHAASATAIAFGCMYICPPLGIAVLCLAIITALSRVFTGAHYPSDVLAGFLLATIISAVGFFIIPILLYC